MIPLMKGHNKSLLRCPLLWSIRDMNRLAKHDDVIKWKHFLRYLLAFCAGNSTVAGEFPAQRPVTRSLGASFDLRLNKRLSKQSRGWWFETPSCPLRRHCKVTMMVAEALVICRYPAITTSMAVRLWPHLWLFGVGHHGVCRCSGATSALDHPHQLWPWYDVEYIKQNGYHVAVIKHTVFDSCLCEKYV